MLTYLNDVILTSAADRNRLVPQKSKKITRYLSLDQSVGMTSSLLKKGCIKRDVGIGSKNCLICCLFVRLDRGLKATKKQCHGAFTISNEYRPGITSLNIGE
jgi:hypothetical protein